MEGGLVAYELLYVAEHLAIGDITFLVLELAEHEVGEESVLLGVEAVSSLVDVGSSKQNDLATDTHAFDASRGVLDVDEGVACACETVEAGVDDEGESFSLYSVEPVAERVDADALGEEGFGIAFRELGFDALVLFSAPTLDGGGVDATREEIGVVIAVGEAVAGIVENDVGVAFLGGNDIFEPVNAVGLELTLGGVVEHFDVAFGDAEGLCEIVAHHFAVVSGILAGGEGGSVVLVGDDECVGVAVVGVGCGWDVDVDVVVVGGHVLAHGADGLRPGVMNGNVDCAATVERANFGGAEGFVAEVIVGAVEGLDVVLNEIADTQDAHPGKLGVVVDAFALEEAHAHFLAIKEDGFIFVVAVFAFIGDVSYVDGVGSSCDTDVDLFAGSEIAAAVFLDKGLGEVADGSHGVGFVNGVGAFRIVVGDAFDVGAVVGNLHHVVELVAAIFFGSIDGMGKDLYLALVVELLVEGQVDEDLFCFFLHQTLFGVDLVGNFLVDGLFVLVVYCVFAVILCLAFEGTEREYCAEHQEDSDLLHDVFFCAFVNGLKLQKYK